MWELAFMYKGQRFTLSFPKSEIPKAILPTVEPVLKGIDLTKYSVVSFIGGQEVVKHAKEKHEVESGLIIICFAEWMHGNRTVYRMYWPQDLDVSKIGYYKIKSQEWDDLVEEIRSKIEKVKVRVNRTDTGVHIAPDQETFSSEWEFDVTSFDEAVEKVRRMRPTWNYWNKIAIKEYKKRGKTDIKFGTINIVKAPIKGSKLVVMKLRDGYYLMFQKVDNEWIDIGEIASSVYYHKYDIREDPKGIEY